MYSNACFLKPKTIWTIWNMLYHFFFMYCSTCIDELLKYLKCLKEKHRELNLNPFFLIRTVHMHWCWHCWMWYIFYVGRGRGGGGRGNVTHLLKSVKEMEKSTVGWIQCWSTQCSMFVCTCKSSSLCALVPRLRLNYASSFNDLYIWLSVILLLSVLLIISCL